MSRRTTALETGQAQKEPAINENFQILSAGSIGGLKLEWLAANSLRVTPGAAHIQSLNAVLESATAITKTSLSLSANTWYHVYLYNNAGNADIEIATAAPAAPYFGAARSKTGDTSRRYLGSVRAIATNTMANFLQEGNRIRYRANVGDSPFRVLAGGLATAETTVSCAAVVPPTARLAQIRVANLATQALLTGTSDDSASPPTSGVHSQAASSDLVLEHPLDSAQAFTYALANTATGGVYIDVYGYCLER